MSCHFDYVFPELLNRNLWGIFYIPTGPYQSGQILDVHKIHLLCGAFDGKELHDLLLQRINKEMIPDTRRKEFHSETYKDKEYMALQNSSEFYIILLATNIAKM